MTLQHVNVKLFAADGAAPKDLSPAIPVFHRWIQQQACPELLIDVADYAHVPAGPGVMLIGHEATYSLDETHDRLGLLYNRRTEMEGDSLGEAVQRAEAAAQRLEAEPEFQGRLRFRSDQIEILLNDRALYPNNDNTWAAVGPEVQSFLDRRYGAGKYTLTRARDPRERFRVTVTAG